jgi:hypothetical protein
MTARTDDVHALRIEAAALRDVVEAIRAFHHSSKDDGFRGDAFCVGCWDVNSQDGAPSWPCDTARIVASVDVPQIANGLIATQWLAQRDAKIRAETLRSSAAWLDNDGTFPAPKGSLVWRDGWRDGVVDAINCLRARADRIEAGGQP